MSLRVSICTTSGFLAIVVRKALAQVRHLDTSGDHRDATSALAALRDGGGVVIIDGEMLWHAGGDVLKKALASRHAPAIVLDARGRGVEDLASSPSTLLVRGHLAGELDLGVIETELPQAVEEARRRHRGLAAGPSRSELGPPGVRPEPHDGALDLVVLGVSTGGPTLLMQLLGALERPTLPMLIVQHMPESETPGFAARLAEECGHPVVEVGAGALPPTGTIGVVQGGHDYRIVRRSGALTLRRTTLPENPFHPSIDEILLSAVAAELAVGAVILTGMGQDGAAGALAVSKKGLPVIAQRPDTCAVAGMPQSAIDNGAARWVQSPDAIAATLNRWWRR